MASRIPVIVSAYLAACFAAGLLLSTAFGFKLAISKDFFSLVLYVCAFTLLIGMYIALFALLPTLPGIIYAERTSVRSFLYYCGGGALVGIVSYGLYALLLIWSAGTATGFFGELPWKILEAHCSQYSVVRGSSVDSSTGSLLAAKQV